jgi:replicative DNA helicase
MSDLEYAQVEKEAKKITDYPIYYVDTPGNVQEIGNTIKFFQSTIAKDKWLVVIIDHTLLIRGTGTGNEREIIVDLEKTLIEAKKIGKTSIIQISQMNRNIEAPERLNNQSMHYPQRSDLSSSDAVFQASDYVIILHRPEILGLATYGYNNLPVKDMVYVHFLKNRDGEVKILKFINDLKYNNLKEPEEEDDTNQQTIEFTK